MFLPKCNSVLVVVKLGRSITQTDKRVVHDLYLYLCVWKWQSWQTAMPIYPSRPRAKWQAGLIFLIHNYFLFLTNNKVVGYLKENDIYLSSWICSPSSRTSSSFWFSRLLCFFLPLITPGLLSLSLPRRFTDHFTPNCDVSNTFLFVWKKSLLSQISI